jgi:hypothetical protein
MVQDSGLVLPCAQRSPRTVRGPPSGGDEQYPNPVVHSVAGRTLRSHPSGTGKPTESTRRSGRLLDSSKNKGLGMVCENAY